MFNMQKIGRRISSLRREHNMTQVELADKLSISFQAVSNWERGNSMPDITKLPELADIFNVSVDELLGERSALVEAAVNNNIAESFDNNQISRDEIVNALPILNTLQMDIVIEKSCNSNPANIDIFLPYMSESDVKELAEKSIEKGEAVDKYLPFMDESDVKELAEKSIERGEAVDKYLPFMNEIDVKELALKFLELKS